MCYTKRLKLLQGRQSRSCFRWQDHKEETSRGGTMFCARDASGEPLRCKVSLLCIFFTASTSISMPALFDESCGPLYLSYIFWKVRGVGVFLVPEAGLMVSEPLLERSVHEADVVSVAWCAANFYLYSRLKNDLTRHALSGQIAHVGLQSVAGFLLCALQWASCCKTMWLWFLTMQAKLFTLQQLTLKVLAETKQTKYCKNKNDSTR